MIKLVCGNAVYFCTLEDCKMKLELTFKSKARQLRAYIKKHKVDFLFHWLDWDLAVKGRGRLY